MGILVRVLVYRYTDYHRAMARPLCIRARIGGRMHTPFLASVSRLLTLLPFDFPAFPNDLVVINVRIVERDLRENGYLVVEPSPSQTFQNIAQTAAPPLFSRFVPSAPPWAAFSPAALPVVLLPFFWWSVGLSLRGRTLTGCPGYLHLTCARCRFARSCKRPLASPHRAANWRRSVDDQPRACSQHRRARLSLQQRTRRPRRDAKRPRTSRAK